MAYYFSNCPNCGALITLDVPYGYECGCGTMIYNYYKTNINGHNSKINQD